jgi:hypothetical protein
MSDHEDHIDWSLTTWEGSRRAMLRDAMNLSLTQKWKAVEEMADWARATLQSRRERGLPYIDLYTGQRMPATRVAEDPSAAPPNPENS